MTRKKASKEKSKKRVGEVSRESAVKDYYKQKETYSGSDKLIEPRKSKGRSTKNDRAVQNIRGSLASKAGLFWGRYSGTGKKTCKKRGMQRGSFRNDDLIEGRISTKPT